MSNIVKLPDSPSWEYMFKAEKILSEGGDRAEAVELEDVLLDELIEFHRSMDDSIYCIY